MSAQSAAIGWGSGWREQAVPRFRIAYRQAERLVAEVARSLNGSCSTLHAPSPQKVGTRFVFELSADLLPAPVEILAEVLSADPAPDGTCHLRIIYSLLTRGGLDAAICRILRSKETEPMRRVPRLPVYLPAATGDGTPGFLVRDLSLYGAGIDLDGLALPPSVQVGTPVRLNLDVGSGRLLSQWGKVVWVRCAGRRPLGPSGGDLRSFGVEFLDWLDDEGLDALDQVLVLKSSPRRTWLTLAST